jgi:putative transcriptional regulator
MPDRRLVVHLKAARMAAGLTQAELALMVGVTRKTINTVENGVFVPSTILALGLARALGVTVEALFSLAPDLSSNL